MSMTTTTTRTSFVSEKSAAGGGGGAGGAKFGSSTGIQLNGGGSGADSTLRLHLSGGTSGSGASGFTGTGGHGGGGATSVVTSTITSRVIKPVSNARTVVINRSLPGASVGFRSGVGQQSVSASSFESRITPKGVSKQLMQSNVGNIMTGREKEKEELRGLNERLANYIEKVRFLEAQNKKLVVELATLRDSWGKETEKIKAMYVVEMEQLRTLLTEAEKAKGELEVRVNSLQDQLEELEIELTLANEQHAADRETIDKLTQQMAEYDSEMSLLRRRVAGFDEERKRDKAEIQRLRDELKRLRADLDQETLNHIKAENEAQSLRDELEFIKQVHDSELKELAALAYRDTTQENRDYWKNEMSQALRDVQNEYDQKMDDMKSEIEAQYSLRVQEARTNNTRGSLELNNLKEENVRIKSQISDLRGKVPDLEARNAQLERLLDELRREMVDKDRDNERDKAKLQRDLDDNQNELETVLEEMQHLLDAKLSLELEIAAYRKLLELEETRVNLGNLFDGTSTSDLENQIISQDGYSNKSAPGRGVVHGGPGGAHGGSGGAYGGSGGAHGGSGGAYGASAGGAGGVAGGAYGSSSGVNVSFGASGRDGSLVVGGGNRGGGGQGGFSSNSIIAGDGFDSQDSSGFSITSTSSVSSMKTINSRTSKGNLTLQECSPDGRFVLLENTGKKREEIGGMKITRNVDGGRQVIKFTIPEKTALDFEGKGKSLKIWARGLKPAGSSDMEIVEDSWGMGANVLTTLTSPDGDEKATHNQKTQFSG